MRRDPRALLAAARVPKTLTPQRFGLWQIRREMVPEWLFATDDWPDMTILSRATIATMHKAHGETVMEDSRRELSRHLPILMAARGRVLVTGLGLGCVVRGLLSVPEVESIDVVEVSGGILRVVGAEFVGDPRVALHHGDALTFPIDGRRWDYAWHDLWVDGPARALQELHVHVLARFEDAVARQGCWMFDRRLARAWPFTSLLGSPRRRVADGS